MAASRFAVLSIEDDEEVKPVEKKSATAAAANNVKKQGNKKAAKKQKAEQERAQLVKLAFAFPKSTKPRPTTKTEEIAQASDPSNWIEDDGNVEVPLDEELSEALRQSKLEYEESMNRYEQQKSEAAAESNKAKKKSKKKSAPVVSMEQFNRPQVQTKASTEVNGVSADTLSQEASNLNEITANEGPRIAQLQEELQQRDDLIAQLRSENEKLRDEILTVKTRNKKLYGILGQGEMREKAELLVELEKLSKIKDELTAEVENLATQLHQEKSRVSQLTEGKKPTGNKK